MGDRPAKSIGAAGIGNLIAQYFPGQILPGLISFFGIPFLTRLFTKDQYGYYILVLSTAATVSSLGFSWVGNCALRFYRTLEKEPAKLFFHLFFSAILTVILLVGIGAIVWPWLSGRYRGIILISVPLTLFLGVNEIMANVLRAQSKAIVFSIYQGLGSLARFLPGILAIVWVSVDVKTFVGGWTIGAFAVAIFLMVLTGAADGLRPHRLDKKLLGEFLRYGGPITAVSLMGVIMGTADRYIIDVFRSSSAVAIYGLSYQLGSISILLISQAIMMAVFPRAVDTYESGNGYMEVAVRGLRYFLIASFCVLAIVGVPAPEILELYGGSGYSIGGNVLRIVMVAVFVMSLAHYFRMPFLVNRRTNTLLPIGVIPAILSVVLNLTLVPLFGGVGSAITLLVSYSLMLLMSIYYSRKTVQIKWPMATLLRCIVAAGVVLVVAWITRQIVGLSSLMILGLAMVAWAMVYMLILYASGEIRKEVNYLSRRVINIGLSRTR